MEYRTLGRSGLKVSAVGIGTNQFGRKVDQQQADAIIGRAIELGINFIDTANVYTGGDSERTIGRALRGRRDAMIIATKVASPVGDGPNDRGASRAHIRAAVEASLKRLETDYIDLYQIHRFDPVTPPEETMSVLDDLVREGKVRYIGASNYAAWQLCRANDIAEFRGWTPFVSVQPHYHMFERGIEAELLPYCEAFGVGILPYYPLAGGFLTGKYRRNQPPPPGSRGESSAYVQKYFTDAYFTAIEKLEAFAQERGHTLGELAIAWLLSRPQVSSVIAGVTTVEQLEQNAKGAEWKLSGEEASQVTAVLDSIRP